MGTGYTRNDTSNNIADGNVINASDLDGEFDAVQAAFNGTTGHSHDGTSGEGPQIAAGGIASDAVTTAKILDANVTTAKIADSNVTTAKILNANVTLAKMAANSVDSDQYVDGSIDRVHLAADIVDGTKIADDSIDSEHYVDGSIDTAHIGNLQVTTAKIAADAIDGTKLSDNAVDSEHYTDGSIDRVHLAADIVDGTKIADDSIDSEHYVDGSIDTAHIANDAVTLGTKTSGNYVAAGATSGTGISGSVSSEGGTFTVTSNATNANTASTIVARDGSGNFSAGTITASLTGTASNAALLDSLDSTQFLRSDAADTKTAGDLSFADNVKAQFGTGSDLQIYHDGANSFIKDNGDGGIFMRATSNIKMESTDGNRVLAEFTDSAGVDLYYNNGKKLATKTDGVDITGELQSDSLDVDGNADISGTLTMGGNIDLQDNDIIKLGTGDDLQIFHDSVNSYISEQGTGSLRIRGTNLNLQDTDGNIFIACTDTGTGGTVNLYQNASLKLNTTSTGVDITGDINDVGDIYLANKVIHAGDTDTYMQFFAQNAWRVVTGNTQMLEVNDNYTLLSSNSVGSVQTASVTGSATANFYVYNSFVWTLTGNITLNNPSTEVAGMSGVFVFIHSGAGRTVSLGTDYETVGGAGLTLSGTSGAVDIVPYFVRAGGNVVLGTPQLAFS